MSETKQLPFGNGSHGEIVCWSISDNGNVSYSRIVDALKNNGLNEKLARELCHHFAFLRGAKKLQENRIIRELRADKTTIVFQFTSEQLEGDAFRYDLEALLSLDKATGKVSCSIPELEQKAQELLNDASSNRTAADISRLIQGLFAGQADLFPIRKQGGAYFVPVHQIDFVDRIESFLKGIGGELTRFVLKTGTANGDKSVKRAVQDGIAAMIDDHLKSIDKLGTSSRESTLEKEVQNIQTTKIKIEGYSLYLDAAKSELEDAIKDASEKLRQKIASLAADKESSKADKSGWTGLPTADEIESARLAVA